MDDFNNFEEHPVDHVTYAKRIALSKNIILFIVKLSLMFTNTLLSVNLVRLIVKLKLELKLRLFVKQTNINKYFSEPSSSYS